MSLKEVKEKDFVLNLGNEEYKLRLDMNALCELEEIYGSINDALTSFKEKPLQAMRNFIYAMLKSEREELTIGEVGKLIKVSNLEETLVNLEKVLEEAFPVEDKENTETVKKTKE